MPDSPHVVAHDTNRAPPSVTAYIPRKPLPPAPSAGSVSKIISNGSERGDGPDAREKEHGKAEQMEEKVEPGSEQRHQHLDGVGSRLPQKRRKIINVRGQLIALPSIFATRPGADVAAEERPRRNWLHYGKRRTYLGLSRKHFMIVVAAAVILILALIIGLAVGLKRTARAKNLPLPQNKDQQTGDLTYYMPGLGACGITNKESDYIVAVSRILFDAVQRGSDPNQNPLCGKKIRTTRFNERVNSNRSVDLTVTDRCVGCKATDIDVTTSVFDQLADRDRGRVLTTWAWLD